MGPLTSLGVRGDDLVWLEESVGMTHRCSVAPEKLAATLLWWVATRGALTTVSPSEQLHDVPVVSLPMGCDAVALKAVSTTEQFPKLLFVKPHYTLRNPPILSTLQYLSPHLLLSNTWFYPRSPAAVPAAPVYPEKPHSVVFSMGRICFTR